MRLSSVLLWCAVGVALTGCGQSTSERQHSERLQAEALRLKESTAKLERIKEETARQRAEEQAQTKLKEAETLARREVCESKLDRLVASAKANLRKNDPVAAYNNLFGCSQLVDSQVVRALLQQSSQAADTKHKRSAGVNLGMTPEEVLASSWGKPRRINRTTGAFGSHEQWVYGGHNYLYFENGNLRTIQN